MSAFDEIKKRVEGGNRSCVKHSVAECKGCLKDGWAWQDRARLVKVVEYLLDNAAWNLPGHKMVNLEKDVNLLSLG